MQIVYLIMIGLITGCVVGLTGASGVVVVVPLLTVLMGFPVHMAIGTSLFIDTITPLFVAWSYYKSGNINLKAGLWLALGSVTGAQIGSSFANEAISGQGMSIGFIIIIFLMAIGMWVKSTRPERPAVENSQIKPFTVKNAAISFGIGLALGIFSGMFGAGGGIAFLIVMITVLKYSTHVAIGTSSLIMSLTAASGTIGYAIHGNVNFGSGLIIAIGSVVGGVLTARLANKVNEQTLEKLIGCVFAGLGVIMLTIE
ncbi:MAG TPA: sulfite exporter TauE/SafE family protein [Flexilinea sp.]|jgi:hypothetical protein|nr:sulfite exporter TauE/SafE family protein [Flexilinea sp.]HPJ64908.1 sulfite exporter TauE/SafE family protein [Flexilinea sp.]HPR70376.1 sulfite exporter TauE/SafE family protein [Flexilinea sp.]HQJ00665.1 sulfite exporter TauE/SafE family protein [Flexilinea sp.]